MDKINAPQREKYWSEKDIHEKIETLRAEIKRLGRASWCMDEVLDSLRVHGHDAAGRIMVPLDGNRPAEAKIPWQFQSGDDQRPF